MALKTERRIGELQQRKAEPLTTVHRLYGTAKLRAEDFTEGEERLVEEVDTDPTSSTYSQSILYKYRKINGKLYKYQYSEIP